MKDFGLIRVVEILGGDSEWDQNNVTTDGSIPAVATQAIHTRHRARLEQELSEEDYLSNGARFTTDC